MIIDTFFHQPSVLRIKMACIENRFSIFNTVIVYNTNSASPARVGNSTKICTFSLGGLGVPLHKTNLVRYLKLASKLHHCIRPC